MNGSDTTVLGRFANGKSAVSIHTYRRGKAIMIGNLPGYAYQKKSSARVKDFICDLANMGGVYSAVSVEAECGKVHASVLVGGQKQAILIVKNEQCEAVNVTIIISTELEIESDELTDLFTGKTVPVQKTAAGLAIEHKLNIGAHEIFSL